MKIYVVGAALLVASCNAPEPENKTEVTTATSSDDEIILKCQEQGEFTVTLPDYPNANERKPIDATTHYRISLNSKSVEQWDGQQWTALCDKGDKCKFSATYDRIDWSSLSIEDDGKEQRTRHHILLIGRTSGKLMNSNTDEFRENYRLTTTIKQATEGLCSKAPQPQPTVETQKF